MGITGLTKLIGDYAPTAIKHPAISNFFGRIIAIDASLFIYQFLTAIRHDYGGAMTNADGESTGHLMGLMYRTISLMEKGIKPVYVFDGVPPESKNYELEKRKIRREEARQKKEDAEQIGDMETVEKMNLRMLTMTQSDTEDCKKLLSLIGVPFITAPGEAEAECAALVKGNRCFAVATEDMDTLAFGGSVVLRHMTIGNQKKSPLMEIRLDEVLRSLEIGQEQFVELCLLLGCDYCPTIRGIGPKRAIELMNKHKSIQNILQNLDKNKYSVPEDWHYEDAKKLFLEPLVSDVSTIPKFKWNFCENGELAEFMVTEKGFSGDKITNCINRLKKVQEKTVQPRIDSFFSSSGVQPSEKRKKPLKPELKKVKTERKKVKTKRK